MKSKEPSNGYYYNWRDFCKFAEENGISLECEEDYLDWWECWKAGYISAMNE